MDLDVNRYEFIGHALHGTGGFRDGRYLVRYPRESEEKYTRRRETAWYASPLARACDRFSGYLARYRPMRDLNNPLLDSFADDCNWRGDSLDLFFDHFIFEAKARGTMLLLVDMPREMPERQDEQIDFRAFPYLVPIHPEQVSRYELDQRGKFSTVTIFEIETELDGRKVRIERTWDTQGWQVKKGEDVIEEGEHGLGVCPVLIFSETGDFPKEGAFSAIADISKRLYNAVSELMEISRSQTFSILAYQIPPEQAHNFDLRQIAETISTDNMLVHSGEPPSYIQPEAGPAEVYFREIEMLSKKIDEIGLNVQPPDTTEAGIAMQMRFQMLNAALSAFARRMEDFERRMWDLVCAWLGMNNTTNINWPKDYSLADMGHELEVLQQMQSVGAPPLYVQEKLKQLISLDFTAVQRDVLDDVLAQVNEAGHERIETEEEDEWER